MGVDVQPSGRHRLHGGPDTRANLIDPSSMLGHSPSICPARMLQHTCDVNHAIRRTGSLLSDPVPTVQQRCITPVVVTMPVLSRRSERTRVRFDHLECPVQVPRYHGQRHSQLCFLRFFPGHLTGYQEQNSARTTGTSRKTSHFDKLCSNVRAAYSPLPNGVRSHVHTEKFTEECKWSGIVSE